MTKVEFAPLGDWDRGGNATVTLRLFKGEHRVVLRKDAGDGCVNLDFLAVPLAP